MLIGIDFDNTIVCYDQLFHEAARENGLIPAEVPASKDKVRSYLRRHNSEKEWTELQGIVYGMRIQEASPFPGVLEFLDSCKKKRISIRIISHKTEYARYDETHTNLREAALNWMADHRFFQEAGLGLSSDFVVFGATRQAKVEHIHQSGCTHFIDDLEEVFLEDTFPANVEKILFASNHQPTDMPGVKMMTEWKEISEYFFGNIG